MRTERVSRALFDVNVLIALLDSDHISHAAATDWHRQHARHGWASCPITENGTARVMSSAGYPNAVPIAEVLTRLRNAAQASNHQFWPDDISLTDGRRFDHRAILGPKQITDRYLLALAVKHNGRFILRPSSDN